MAFITTDNTGAALITDLDVKERLFFAYSSKALERQEELNDEVFGRFGNEYPVEGKQGDQVIIQKNPTLAAATTPLAQGIQAAKYTTFQVEHIPLELERWGNDIGWATKADITARDVMEETHSKELVMNARETVAQLYIDELDTLSVTDWGTGATLAQLIALSNSIRRNKTRGFDELNGNIVMAIGYASQQDLMLEGGAAYKDHYQVKDGSEVLADGMMSKAVGGTNIFVSTMVTVASSEERIYCWGDGAFASVMLRSGIAGANGKTIGMPGVGASLLHYVIPATASHATPYADSNIAAWCLRFWDVTIADANRVAVAKVDL